MPVSSRRRRRASLTTCLPAPFAALCTRASWQLIDARNSTKKGPRLLPNRSEPLSGVIRFSSACLRRLSRGLMMFGCGLPGSVAQIHYGLSRPSCCWRCGLPGSVAQIHCVICGQLNIPAVACREASLRYTTLAIDNAWWTAVACREASLRYTMVRAVPVPRPAVACREASLRYTGQANAYLRISLWLAGKRRSDTL